MKVEKRSEYYYDAEDAINEVRENAFRAYIEKGKSTWEGRPVDLENSSYVEDKEDLKQLKKYYVYHLLYYH